MLTLDYTTGLSQSFLNNFPQLPYKRLIETSLADELAQTVAQFRAEGEHISSHYYVVDMTTISQKSELYQLLQKVLDAGIYSVHMQPCIQATISLRDSLSERTRCMVCPILYLIDDISQLVELPRWADVRHNIGDLVIDLDGSVIPMHILAALPSLDYDGTAAEITMVFSETGQSCDVTLQRNPTSTTAEKE